MKLRPWFLVLALLHGGAALAQLSPDAQAYPLSAAQRQANAARVAGDLQRAPAPWRAAPLVYYEVPAVSPVKRLPDAFPEDGRFLGPLQVIAAQDEYEPASFVAYAPARVARLEVVTSALTGAGTAIPASAVEVKIVKVWYQAGSAWYGYFADRTQRVAIPELLLRGENLVQVDFANREHYVRYACLDGSSRYAWMSFG